MSDNNRVLFPRKVIFTEENSVIISCNLIPPEYCDKIIQLCEEHNQWQNDDSTYYPQATFDMEVVQNHKLIEYLKKIYLINIIDKIYELYYNCKINYFDDLFVIKYQANNFSKSELLDHIDAGDISFMIALSNKEDYCGGGTYFRIMDETIHLDRGSMITFDAKLFHRGVKITKGTRYLLVGFCYTIKTQESI